MLTQVVLTNTVEKIGEKGDITSVKRGFARNFLIPRGLAKKVNKEEIALLKEEQKARQEKIAETISKGEELKKQLSKKRVCLTLPASSSGKLYGSVTVRDIHGAVYETYGIDLPDNAIILEPVKSVGLHLFHIATKDHGEVPMKVKVVAAKS